MMTDRKLFNFFADLGERIAPPFLRQRKNILVINNDESTLENLAKTLPKGSINVQTAKNFDAVLPRLKRQAPDLIVVDIGNSPHTGVDMVNRLRAHGTNVPVIVLTAGSGQMPQTPGVTACRRDVLNADVTALRRKIAAALGLPEL